MLKGTRIIEGVDAVKYMDIVNTLRHVLLLENFEEVIVPAIWNEETFTDKVGEENANMMWRFEDKGGRNVCLIPEVTGIFQELWKSGWKRQYGKRNIFYVSKCYRYEKPQAGRYREFTQFGIEMLGSDDVDKAKFILKKSLSSLGIEYTFVDSAKRGLSYYTEDGFEVESDSLGAQKQIAGGGKYSEGVGWAIGVDRVMLLR